MRGHQGQDDGLKAFISARTQDLHRSAYQLTASQESAERLVVAVLTDLHRDRVDLSRADAVAYLRMTELAGRDDRPTQTADLAQLPTRFHVLARLSPRQRAALVLRVIAGYDDRAIGRTLHLSSRATAETLHSIPYDELPSVRDRPGELRSLLEDFGDLATAPSASTTLADVRAVPPTPRRPWWTYAAAFLVIALTATSVIVTQGWHKDWLKTPDGLNHAHGTHFPTYTQGYRLVTIEDIRPGLRRTISAGTSGALALPCGTVGPDVHLSVLNDANGSYNEDYCPRLSTRPRLTPVAGKTSATVVGGDRASYAVAVYRKLPRNEYPVATKDFEVQHDLTLNAVRKEVAARDARSGSPKRPVLTMHGTAAHPNGTFKGKLRLPHFDNPLAAPMLRAAGLLSPTTTGEFRVQIGQTPPTTACGEPRPMEAGPAPRVKECSLVDRQVPQVKYQKDVLPDGDWIPVEITVKNASGPWTLQVVADTYGVGSGSSD